MHYFKIAKHVWNNHLKPVLEVPFDYHEASITLTTSLAPSAAKR